MLCLPVESEVGWVGGEGNTDKDGAGSCVDAEICGTWFTTDDSVCGYLGKQTGGQHTLQECHNDCTDNIGLITLRIIANIIAFYYIIILIIIFYS